MCGSLRRRVEEGAELKRSERGKVQVESEIA